MPLLVSALLGGPFCGWLGGLAFYCLGGPDIKLWLAFGARGLALWQLRVTLGLGLVLFGLVRATRAPQPRRASLDAGLPREG